MAKTTLAQLKSKLKSCEAIGKQPVHVPVHERPSRSVSEVAYAVNPGDFVVICGATLALRCRAKSKQAGRRCRNAASKGMRVCRFHGGASTQISAAARKRASERMTVHGQETRQKRRERKQKVAEFRFLERVMREHDYFRLRR